MNFLIQLTENDKRILIALGILLILVFVIVGYIGLLIERIMKRQAKRVGFMMHDVVAAKIVTTEHEFKKLARRKSNRIYAKAAVIPVLILLFAAIIYLIYGAVSKNWGLKIFDYKTEGFSTILPVWDFANAPRAPFFGNEIICDWPPLLNTPHWEGTAWASYLITPCLFVGGIWLLVVTQAHMSRAFRINKLSKTVMNPTLDNVTAPSSLNNNQSNQ